jgi:hypothetical protein
MVVLASESRVLGGRAAQKGGGDVFGDPLPTPPTIPGRETPASPSQSTVRCRWLFAHRIAASRVADRRRPRSSIWAKSTSRRSRSTSERRSPIPRTATLAVRLRSPTIPTAARLRLLGSYMAANFVAGGDHLGGITIGDESQTVSQQVPLTMPHAG